MILNILLVITRIHSFKGRIWFQELDILDCNMTNSSQLLISVKVPNLILGIETSLLELLGHSPKALYGQSIEIFRGPETDRAGEPDGGGRGAALRAAGGRCGREIVPRGTLRTVYLCHGRLVRPCE